jgi:prolyl-tRNA synthetase
VVELQARRETEAAKIPVESALEAVLTKLDTL